MACGHTLIYTVFILAGKIKDFDFPGDNNTCRVFCGAEPVSNITPRPFGQGEGNKTFPFIHLENFDSSVFSESSACPACPVAPLDGTGVAPEDGTGVR